LEVDAMKNIISMCLVICCGLYAATSHATLATYNDRAVFNLQGSIVYNYGFEDFTGGIYYFPGDPWTSHGVTYTTTENLILAPSLVYGNTSNILVYNHWTPLMATISPDFNMFGFDIGLVNYINNAGPVNFQITTNLGTYNYNNLSIADTHTGLDFFGFKAGFAEYFTGIRIDSTNDFGSAPALDNVTLGNRSGDPGFPPSSGPVPEPSTFLLLSAGLIGVGFLRKRMRK
jgi:hypothetical protein